MKEYKVVKVGHYSWDTEFELNRLAQEGWELVCIYSEGLWLIVSRRKIENETN